MRAMPQSFVPPNRLTGHARARMQQRGISAAAPEALPDFGRAKPAGGGREIIFFDKKSRRRVARLGAGPKGAGPLGSGPGFDKRSVSTISDLTPNLISDLTPNFDRVSKTYAILESDGTVITVGHRTRRIPR